MPEHVRSAAFCRDRVHALVQRTSGDIVDDVSALTNGARSNVRSICVYREQNMGRKRASLDCVDGRQHSGQFLLFPDRLGARSRRLTSDIDDVSAFLRKLLSGVTSTLGRKGNTAIAEAVGSGVDGANNERPRAVGVSRAAAHLEHLAVSARKHTDKPTIALGAAGIAPLIHKRAPPVEPGVLVRLGGATCERAGEEILERFQHEGALAQTGMGHLEGVAVEHTLRAVQHEVNV
jgi:hypothetical protein